jgi:hypothetical protein
MASMLKLVCAVLLAACTHHTTCPPPVAPAAASDDVPPPDDQLKKWQAIHANKDRLPAGTTAGKLLPELVAYLGSVDPARRDGIAFEVFVSWIVKEPTLSPEELKGLIGTLEGNLAGPLDARDGVYLRSFSALVLSLIVKRDLDKPFLDDAERRKLLDAAVAYAGRETDLRGHTGKRGWAHAAAHTSDLLKFLAREPTFTDEDRLRVLDGAVELAARKHGGNFHHGEDSRIAIAVLEAVKRGVPDDKIEPWLARLAAPLGRPETADFDPALYGAQRNARNLVFTLFVQLSVDPKPSEDAKAMLQAIRTLIAS